MIPERVYGSVPLLSANGKYWVTGKPTLIANQPYLNWYTVRLGYLPQNNMNIKAAFYETYPFVFPDGAPENGFYCGSGWFQLLDSLFIVITKELQNKNKTDFRITFIKEKFGQLMIGCCNSTDYINDVIAQAEEMSSHICETCGEYGKLRDSAHWIKVRCDECEKKYFIDRELSPEAKKALLAGIKSAKESEPIDCGSFAQYADDESD